MSTVLQLKSIAAFCPPKLNEDTEANSAISAWGLQDSRQIITQVLHRVVQKVFLSTVIVAVRLVQRLQVPGGFVSDW